VVSGPTARARVSQIFHNPTDGWVEAVYVYPLPEGGAVDTLKMVIGERIIASDAFPETISLLAARGWEVVPVSVSEFAKAEGGVTCMSLVFNTGLD